jgi:hypothetical protein
MELFIVYFIAGSLICIPFGLLWFWKVNEVGILDREITVYNAQKAELQLKNPNGGFVVIRDKEVLGVWQTRADALRAGIQKYGNVSFLVKDIFESPPIPRY